MKLRILLPCLLGTIFILSACGDHAHAEEATTTTPSALPDVSTITNQYQLHTGLFNNVLADISDTEADRRISNNTNSVAWIAGHTLDIQYNLAALLGLETENPYADQFAFGKKFDAAADYPAVSKMLADWNALAPRIQTALGQLSAETLETDAPFPIPYPAQTMRGLYEFQMHHLAYEIGQLALYRKYLGKAAMSYQ